MTKSPKEPRAPKTTRVSFLRVGVLVVTTLAVVAGFIYFIKPQVIPPQPPGPSTFAGYVDVTVTPSYPFETPSGPAQQDVVLAFIVAGRDEPCTPTWGTYYTLDQAASDLELDRRISQLRLTGGRARVSFGGAINQELSTSCTDPSALVDAYKAVIDRYELASIDLDVEGSNLSDTAGNERRAAAIKAVQDQLAAEGRPLEVWLTLPVATYGLTDEGIAASQAMLDAGVNLTGVNGMTMNFGGSKSTSQSMSDAVIQAATNLKAQVRKLYSLSALPDNDAKVWAKVGITPMIGQNDVPGEVFTIDDAQVVNEFAREKGAGLISMWNLNRDATCTHPLPTVITVVQTSCSGVDQQGKSFADILAADTDDNDFVTASPAVTATAPIPTPTATSPVVVDDPATSPYPIWDPLGTYPAGTKVVWRQQVYQAKWYTSGFAPDTPVATQYDTPWTLIGPVLPGDTPAPLPTVAPNTYPEWDPDVAYVAGSRVQLDLVPYQAKWWTQGQKPGVPVSGGSPWIVVYPGG
ncbi:MAG: glycosyl hydrolase family 18 protein [bacterium]|nr:glycosyl hydrolase family 18 protein [bacterium]